MKPKKITRRQAIVTGSAGALAAMAQWPSAAFGINTTSQSKLAIQGGEKIHQGGWPRWPEWNQEAEKNLADMFRTGRWFRGSGEHVIEFENKYAELIGTKRCLATASGTTSLITAMHALGVDAGDEVLVSPYTFIATYNAILMLKALPVFVDSDPETFLINPGKIEERITERTSAIVPVHIYGLPVDMDSVNTVARKHGLKVIEDACQAWLAEYKGKKAGNLGDLGCFSFQNSKNLPAGEGGAVTGNDDETIDRCNAFHNCGRPVGKIRGNTGYPVRGGNFRMQQSQAIILMSQMPRIFADNEVRQKNAAYLNKKLGEIPGIIPYKMVPGATKSAFHLYPFRYVKEKFDKVPKQMFLKALNAEGIPGSAGYGKQNKDGLFEETLNSKGFKRLFPEARLKKWREENIIPGNDQLCDEAVVFTQNILLGSQNDMDDIVNAISKIYQNRKSLIS